MDKFTYLGRSISSTENDISMILAKAQTAIDRLSIIWKSVLSNKIKRNFFPSIDANSNIWMHHIDATYKEKAWRELHKNATSYIEEILEAISQKTAAVRSPTSHL